MELVRRSSFVLPMLSVVIYGFGREVTRWDCFWIAVLWMLSAIVLTVATAFEGLICIIMMLPLAAPIVILGLWSDISSWNLDPNHPAISASS